MTDRIHSLLVVLDHDLRDDDCKPLVEAIQRFRGVASVDSYVSDPTTHMAEVRAKVELRTKLYEVLK